MITALISLIGGGVLLYFGAEWLVGGSSGLARSLGVPQLIIGLTVVAYGTSAPEIVVGVKASFAGAGHITLGNVIGSNIANLALILGLTALISPPRVDGALVRREIPVLVLSTIALPLMLIDGVVSRVEGLGLVAVAAAYTVLMVRAARRESAALASAKRAVSQMESAADEAGAPTPSSRKRMAATALGGLAFLVLGGSLFVDGASDFARVLGVSERVIGLTIVAVGTSLPELATSVIAARRGHSDLAVGNVVGSNIFNVLLCLGVGALVAPVVVPLAEVTFDLQVLAAVTFFGVVILRSARTMTRVEGALLLAGYVAFLVAL